MIQAHASSTPAAIPLPASPASGIRHIAPDAGRSWWIMNNHQVHKLSGADTRGALSLWFETFGPGEGPPPHIHGREDEVFVVLEGTVTFFSATDGFEAGPGSVVLVPRGEQHTFRNTGAGMARMVILVTPAGFEKFFAEAAFHGGTRDERPRPNETDVQRLIAAAPRYGLTFCPPSSS